MKCSDIVVLAAISFAVSFCGVFGVSYILGEGWPCFELWAEVALVVLFTPVVAAVIFFIDSGYAKWMMRQRTRTYRESRFSRLAPKWTVGSIAVFSAIMAACWLPWYIANFPGGTYWDTYYQIFQVYPENHPIAVIPWAEIYEQTLTDARLVDHHPIFTTLVYGAFGWISDRLTGNWMAGVAVFCAMQGMAHIVVFTASTAYLRRMGCPCLLCFLVYLFFALMPPVSTWAMCMVKDSMFGLFCILYFMMMVEALRTHGCIFERRRFVVLFSLCALMLCLTKKTGIFVVVPVAIAGVVFGGGRWRDGGRCGRGRWRYGERSGVGATSRTFRHGRGGGAPMHAFHGSHASVRLGNDLSQPIAGLHASHTSGRGAYRGQTDSNVSCGSAGSGDLHAPASGHHKAQSHVSRSPNRKAVAAYVLQGAIPALVTLVVFPFILFPALHIEPGGTQEALGPMLQQTARYVHDYPGDVTAEEAYAISQVVDYGKLESQYEYDFQDSVKYRFNLDATAEDIKMYIKSYFDMGFKRPDAYFGSLISLAGFYVAPTAYLNIRMVTVDTKMGEEQRYMLWNPDELDGLRLGLDDAYKEVASTPVINLPFLMVVYVFWLPMIAIYLIRRRRLKCGLLMVMPLVLLAFCIVAPVYDARYAVPIVDVAPLLVAALFIMGKQAAGERGLSDKGSIEGHGVWEGKRRDCNPLSPREGDGRVDQEGAASGVSLCRTGRHLPYGGRGIGHVPMPHSYFAVTSYPAFKVKSVRRYEGECNGKESTGGDNNGIEVRPSGNGGLHRAA